MEYNPITVTDLNKYIKNKIDGDEMLNNVLVKGEILAGYLDRGARVFVKKFLPQIAAGIARWYYAGSKWYYYAFS